MKKLFALWMTFVLMITLCSCGEQAVPVIVAFELVGECKYYNSDYVMSKEIEHSYDSESHTDSATLLTKAESNYGSYISTCDAIFQYDRSSDTWSVLSAEEWTQPVYTFYDNLVRTWNVGNTLGGDRDSYEIEITSVQDDSISLNYKISNIVYGGLFAGDVLLELSGSATVTYRSDSLWIPIELPDHFYAQNGINSSHSTDLCISLNIAQGVESAYISGNLSYVE